MRSVLTALRERSLLVQAFFLTAIFFTLLFSVLFGTRAYSNSTNETWMDWSEPVKTSAGSVLTDADFHNLLRRKQSILPDIPCTDDIVPASPNDYPGGQIFIEGCWYDTPAGRLEKGGYGFKPANSPYAGYINSFNSQIFTSKNGQAYIEVVANPSSSTGMSMNVRRSDSFVDTMGVRAADTGWDYPIFFEWTKNPSLTINFKDDTPWPVSSNTMYSQFWYSNNGNHAAIWYADEHDRYIVLLDLTSFTLQTIALRDTVPLTTFASLAVSDSGRYLAVNISGQQGITVYDTWECAVNSPVHVTTPVACSSRVIRDEIINEFSDGHGRLPNFYDDGTMGLYINYGADVYEHILHAPHTRTGSNYIALGDSYSSGEGAYYYRSGTDEPNNRCHLSEKSYPYVIDQNLELDSVHSVACSGAQIHNIIKTIGKNAAQNKKYPNNMSLGKWLPGYKWQIEHIKDQTNAVDVVTIGVGGNDIGFSSLIRKCIAPSECYGTAIERYEIAEQINDQFERLVSLYTQVRSEALKQSATARVYAVGYPQIVKAHGSCGHNVHLTGNETELATGIINHLNKVIKQAAVKAGVTYISIEDALYDHRLCEDTDTPSVNGLGAGRGAPFSGIGPFANESYHPNGFGYKLIAKTIQERTDDFSEPLPFPNSSAEVPDPMTSLLVQQAPDMTDEIRKLLYGDDLVDNIIFKPEEQLVYAEGAYYQLKTRDTYQAYFTSEPTYVGEFETDDNGNLEMRFAIPESLNPGIHSLHIYGKNIYDESIDIYKTTYVAASEHDWDGDGIPNESEVCGIFEPAHIDVDRDGIDDACDSIINPAPITNEDNEENNSNPTPHPSQSPGTEPELPSLLDRLGVLSDTLERNPKKPNSLSNTGHNLPTPILIVSLSILVIGIRICRKYS